MPIPYRSLYSAAALLLAGCIISGHEEKPKGTEVENELSGRLYLADGQPAAKAKVRLFPVTWNPRSGSDPKGGKSYVAETGADGKYSVSVEPGEYNVMGSRDEQVSYRDSVQVAASTHALPSDTLGRALSASGIVAVQPNHLPTIATVELIGTQFFANVGLDGRFSLDGLAAGRYTLRVSTTMPEYTPLYKMLVVGIGDTLADTLRPVYTGIPVVLGLKAAYDTAHGVARISWLPAEYPLLSDYAVFRDEAGYSRLSDLPLRRVTATGFLDSIYPEPRDQDEAEALSGRSQRFEYRVKVENKSDKPGETFGYVSVDAPSPAAVRTFLDLASPGFPDTTLSVLDTARIALAYRNSGRGNDSLSWFIGGNALPARVVAAPGHSGADTLRFAAPDSAILVPIRVVARDEAGSLWERRFTVRVIADAPRANAGRDTSASVGEVFKLQGSASQRFGSIRSWEWDIGAKGFFVRTSGPDTVIGLPNAPDTAYRCVLRVTDDDGGIGIDTVSILIAPSTPFGPLALPHMPGIAALGGNLYFLGDNGYDRTDQVLAMDMATKTVRTLKPMPEAWAVAAALPYQDRILVFAGRPYINRFSAFDPAKETWTDLKPIPDSLGNVTAARIDGKVYVMGYVNGAWDEPRNFEYDFATDAWTKKTPIPGSRWFLHAVALGGKIYLLGHPTSNDERMQIYDPATDTWAKGAPVPRSTSLSAVAVNGKIMAFGGQEPVPEPRYGYVPAHYAYLYDPAGEAWTAAAPMRIGRVQPTAIAVDTKVFILQGECTPGAWDIAPHPEMCETHEEYLAP